MSLHTEVCPFKCGLCGKGFIEPKHLSIHLRMHSLETQPEETIGDIHKCRYCVKEYDNRKFLLTHLREVHAEQPTSVLK